jgi:hypothetical protein
MDWIYSVMLAIFEFGRSAFLMLSLTLLWLIFVHLTIRTMRKAYLRATEDHYDRQAKKARQTHGQTSERMGTI